MAANTPRPPRAPRQQANPTRQTSPNPVIDKVDLTGTSASTGYSNPGVDLDALKSFDPLVELGAVGLKQARGYPYEEWLPELQGERGRRTYREMIDSDTIVGAILFAIEMMSRQVNWSTNPASPQNVDLQAAEFLKECLFDDMSSSFNEVLSEIMSFPAWGWSWQEISWKQRNGDSPGDPYVDDYGRAVDPARSKFNDGKIGIRKIATRGQETLLHWIFDDTGGIRAMVQLPPPDFRRRTIPIEKSLLFRTVGRKNNPEGRSILRNAYEAWYYKRMIQKIEAIGVERDLAGIPVLEIPAEYTHPDAPDAFKKIYEQAKVIVRNIRNDEQAGIVMPQEHDDKGNPLFKLSLLSTAGSKQFSTTEIIDRYDHRIAASVLADFITVGSKGAGSLALARTKTNIWALAMGTFLDHVAEIINKHLIPRLFEINGWRVDRLPTVSHSRLAAFPLEDLAAYITALSQAGLPMFPSADGELERHLFEAGDLPVPQTPMDEADDPTNDADTEEDPETFAGAELSEFIPRTSYTVRGHQEPRGTRKRIERDHDGRIAAVVEEPL